MKTQLRALAALAVCLGTLCSTRAGTYKHIVIDGNFSDWAGVPLAYSDPSEEGANAGTDFKSVWIAHDADYVYVRVSFYNSGSILRSQNNVFINGDGDSSTGFGIHGTGSEMLVQGGTGYQEKNGTFNDGSLIQNLGWAAAPTGSTNEFEFRVSRKATYEDGGSVFTSESIGILLETENPNYSEVDAARDDGPMEYTLTAAPGPANGTSQLVPLTTSDWRFNRTGTDPGADWREIVFDDTQPGWQSGRALFGKTPTPSAYPVAIATPFADNQVTTYFRTKFTWDKDTKGVSLIASNYLSDGAVVYLNGGEVGRLRMPAGAPTVTTPAAGANPSAGQVEILDLPASALVVGDNVLAVEVHQSANDTSDLVFGLSLLASDQLPVGLVAPTAPQTVLTDEGAPVTLTVTARGAEPITYQWYKAGVAIANATNSTFAIAAATPADQGGYQAKLSNAFAQNVTSPIITLQTRAVPVTITDAKLPADVSVTAGDSASFTVAVAGSRPISFQWFKDGLAVTDATNQTYAIPVVLPTQAGEYTAVISNRVTSPLTSRAAKLTVQPDTTAPGLLSATGGGRHVMLVFSEPVDAASINPSAFVITPTIAVTGAKVSADNASNVILDTAALQPGSLYTVAVSGVKDRFGNAIAAGAKKQFRATILIDGDFSDWEGIPIAYSDPEDAGPDTGAHADFKDIWITSDNDYIYLRFTLWREGDPFIFYNNIFVDADNDSATGYAFNGIGSDMLIQGGGGYEQKAGVFNDGGVDNLDWQGAPDAPATAFEVRFSRHATYADADAGGLVFKSDTIALVLESENTGFVAKETAPDSGVSPIVHTLLNYAVTELGQLTATRAGGTVTISWSGPGKLQATDSLQPANWQDVPNATSPYPAKTDAKQRFYRLISP